jgi:multicomponent Na+:H+ antiporter subunit E
MRRIALFLVSLVIWYLLTWPYNFQTRTMDWQILVAGGVFALLASILFVEVFTKSPRKLFAPARYFWALCYIPVLFFYMAIANLDVVYRVIHPKMPIKPGIVKVKTSLTSESGRTALANSITLTPGTMSVDITDDGHLYIHWINVKATDVEGASRRIVAHFEKLLSRIFD